MGSSPRSARRRRCSSDQKTRGPRISSPAFTARAPPPPSGQCKNAGEPCFAKRCRESYLRLPSAAFEERPTMLPHRDEIREDKAFDRLTDAILQRDQPRTADLFYRMLTNEGRSIGEALSVVTAAEAPFVQVPCHVNIKDGAVVLTNNDHTILGLRASTYLMPYLPEKYRLLPLLQSVWYIPAGLDIWNQLLYKYPGRYPTMKGVQVPPPPYGPVVWQDDQEPIYETGTIEERLHSQMVATVAGDSKRSYGLFLGLADDEAIRPQLRDQLEFLGLIDL